MVARSRGRWVARRVLAAQPRNRATAQPKSLLLRLVEPLLQLLHALLRLARLVFVLRHLLRVGVHRTLVLREQLAVVVERRIGVRRRQLLSKYESAMNAYAQ